jgi:hypothetical protein
MARTTHYPAGSRVFIQTSAGTPLTITAVTKAKPAVATYDGTDPADGDYFIVNADQGMTQLDERVVKIANVDTGAKTFELANIDTTDFDTFTTGSMLPVDITTELTTTTGFSSSGGDQNYGQLQYLSDDTVTEYPTNKNPLRVTIPSTWNPDDTSADVVRKADETNSQLAVIVRLKSGLEMLFSGYVNAPQFPSADDINAPFTSDVTIAVKPKPPTIIPAA